MNNRYLFVMVTWFSLFISGCAGLYGAAIQDKNAERNKVKIENLISKAHSLVNFNGAVLIVQNGRVLLSTSVGHKTPQGKELLTSEALFAPGSIAKEYSTVALMRLKEEGKLNFNDRLSKYLPELPTWAKDVSIEHLLNHTSGIPDVKYRRNMTTDMAMDDISLIKSPNFAPGSEFLYSNNNTILRSLVIEKVTGKRFQDYVQDELFRAVSMNNTFLDGNFERSERVASGAYSLELTGVTAYTNVEDLMRWETALWSGALVNEQFLEDVILKPSLGGKGRAYYDFGFYRLDKSGEIASIEHDGTYPRHYAMKHKNFEKDFIIIMLSNDGRKATLSELTQAISSYLITGKINTPYIWKAMEDTIKFGAPSAVSALKRQIKDGELTIYESQLNDLGYFYFEKGLEQEALSFLALNISTFPHSINTYDSYIEVLLAFKRNVQAIPYIEKGLKLAEKSENKGVIKRFKMFAEIARSK